MKIKDLQFHLPDELVATRPQNPCRVLWQEGRSSAPNEISFQELLHRLPVGDVLVVNNTKVLKRRVFIEDLEIVFIKQASSRIWEVLFPSRKFEIGDVIQLPNVRNMKILKKGRPQLVEVDQELNEAFFEQHAALPLPPYIQKARGERKPLTEDLVWYQSAWAKQPGSLAAPTASLHFSNEQLQQLAKKGVQVLELTLHVGLGTFLPVQTEDLQDHVMHAEYVEIPEATMAHVRQAREDQRGVWALGTTVARALESVGQEHLQADAQGNWCGCTDLKIMPGFQWKYVNRLITNFHQPQSTLLALVAGFLDLPTVQAAYTFAIERKFRLLSYGDLSVWIKK